VLACASSTAARKPGIGGYWPAAAAAKEAIGGGIDGADIGRLLPEDQSHQVGGDEQVRIGQGLIRLRGRNIG
jgi:hypothetical protein